MYRTFVLAKLVVHVLSESCEFNHESQDFSIKFEGAEFTLKIDEEAGTVTTTTIPNVHTKPETTEIPITSAIEYTVEGYGDESEGYDIGAQRSTENLTQHDIVMMTTLYFRWGKL